MGLKQQDLRAYEAFMDEGLPLCIVPRDGRDEGLHVSIFTTKGSISGVAIYDADDDARVVSVAGYVPSSHLDYDSTPPDRFDSISGHKIDGNGWTVTAPASNKTWEFETLLGIMTALNTGLFGLEVHTPAQQEPRGTCCPSETCNTCPDAWTCAGLRAGLTEAEAETYSANAAQEPLGWSAPELG